MLTHIFGRGRLNHQQGGMISPHKFTNGNVTSGPRSTGGVLPILWIAHDYQAVAGEQFNTIGDKCRQSKAHKMSPFTQYSYGALNPHASSGGLNLMRHLGKPKCFQCKWGQVRALQPQCFQCCQSCHARTFQCQQTQGPEDYWLESQTSLDVDQLGGG